jgi:hypothetical protein
VDAKRLQESSRKHVIRSLDAWAEGERDIAVLHCGISVEHLLKAFLASKHPSLLVDPRDFSSLLYAVGEGDRAPVGEHLTKSIGASECFRRVAQFIQLPATPQQAEPIFSARNGVAHLGIHEIEGTDETIAVSVKIIDAVLAALGIERFEYWNPYAFRVEGGWTGPSGLDSARERRDQIKQKDVSHRSQDSLNSLVASKISQARIVLEAYGNASPFRTFRRYPEVKPLEFDEWLIPYSASRSPSRGGDSRSDYAAYCRAWSKDYYGQIDRLGDEVLRFLQGLSSYDRSFPVFRPELFNVPSRFESCVDLRNQRWVKCPACGFTMAALREQGLTYIGPVEWAQAYEEDYLEVWKIIQPELLDCPVCLLRLDGNDELEVVGLDQVWNENGPLDTN